MTTLRGSCHCGNLEVELDSAIAPEAFEVRACQCSFCSRHGARTISDPKGRLVIRVADPDRLCRYRFGLQTSEALVCGRCGCYVAAVMPEHPQLATLNARVLAEWDVGKSAVARTAAATSLRLGNPPAALAAFSIAASKIWVEAYDSAA